MKQLMYLGILLLLTIGACTEPPVVFTEAQPQGLPAEPYINMVYRGTFFCESDSATVHIKARTIHKERLYAFSIPKAEVDTMQDATLEDSVLVIKGFEESIPVEIINDTLYADIMIRDTLFEMSSKQILKYYKGHQVISKELGPEKWEVIILSLDGDMNLRLSEAILPADLEALEEITPVEDISTEEQIQIRVSPSYLEFGEILQKQLIFQECDLFTRMKLTTEI